MNTETEIPEHYWLLNFSRYHCRTCETEEYKPCEDDPCCKSIEAKERKSDNCTSDNNTELKNKTSKDTDLHLAVYRRDVEKLKELLDKGADINSKDKKGRTALHMAALLADVVSANVLLDRGADPNAKCSFGHAVLFYALQINCVHVIQLLIDRGADVRERFGGQETKVSGSYLHYAITLIGSKRAQLLIHNCPDLVNTRDWEHETPLLLACRQDKLEIVRLLVQHNANLEATSKDGETALSIAIQKKFPEDLIFYLLEHGAKVDQPTCLLHKAVSYSSCDIVTELLDRGADVDARDNGQTPLHIACREERFDMVKLLLDRGADIEAKIDLSSRTSLSIALQKLSRKEIALYLLERGAKVNYSLDDGSTLLHYAIRYSDEEIVQALVKRGADVRAITREERCTPLHCVFEFSISASLRFVISLVQSGANVNARDHTGQTPLHYAAKVSGRRFHTRTMQVLLDSGAIVDAEDSVGWTPLVCAAKCDQSENLTLLLRNGANLFKMRGKVGCGRIVANQALIDHLCARVALAGEAERKDFENSFGKKFEAKEGNVSLELRLEECRSQVEIMRRERVCNNEIRVIDLLNIGRKRVLLLLDRYKPSEILSHELLAQLPDYRWALERKVSAPTKQRCLFDRSIEILDRVCQSRLPVEMLERIADHFSIGDMVNLKKAASSS